MSKAWYFCSVKVLLNKTSSSAGRRAPLLLGLFGLLVYQVLQMVNTLVFSMFSVYYMQFLAELVLGFVGGSATSFIGTISIITDDSRHELLPVNFLRIGFSMDRSA
ncbi:unnamed protein product [Gongylonema pulchrum]|uniref:Battenin n=1 Tax=Gongylonema pulchrum TaxID=637853 RepID=A0A183EB33_9BILA|nr:unnamed protein product [Gongylonema pulchrum]